MKKFFVKLGKDLKESFRKLLVSLKRRPHNIAFVMLLISFVQYSFNLTDISNTTAQLMRKNMGLYSFVIMLFTTLAIVCFLNSFPKRQKPRWIMVALYVVMIGVVITCDLLYADATAKALASGNFDPAKYPFVPIAQKTVVTNAILLGVTLLLTATIPVYGKLLKKINTSIEVEYTDTSAQVELADE
ncbi:MAG: hypothetical protein IKC58_00020 [Clostridia bacterium]|nr:hypothetical protein [Clostridia bacterium]MBR2984973.1 hypothetical protein [Clostridia bacterium]